MQQVLKVQAASVIEADQLVLADSDVILVREITADTFRRNGKVRFYRKDAGVHDGMPRHVIWHDVSRKMLGLRPEPTPLPDYVSAFNVWDRGTILALQERIERTSGHSWLTEMSSQLHVSEFILYGVFVDKVLGDSAQATPSDSILCHSYWDNIPLNESEATRFVRELPDDDVAIMITAKSHTPIEVRRAAMSIFRSQAFEG
jgi:hypothetical protein